MKRSRAETPSTPRQRKETSVPSAPLRESSETDELPHGWASAPLGEIAEINPRHPKGLHDAMPVTFVPMAALGESTPDFQFTQERPLGAVRKGFTHFAEGDVLFAKITPCMENGKGAVGLGLRNKLGCGTTELHILRPFGGISPDYVYRFLAQPAVRHAATENFTGTAGQARVPTSFIRELEIPLAPLAEQRRIVAKLEKLLGQVEACQQRLTKIPALLKRFRQAILAAACSGRLTADWRNEHSTIETAEDLLGRIREKRLASAQTQKEKAQIAEVFDERTLRIDEGDLGLDDIPDTWFGCRVGALQLQRRLSSLFRGIRQGIGGEVERLWELRCTASHQAKAFPFEDIPDGVNHAAYIAAVDYLFRGALVFALDCLDECSTVEALWGRVNT